MKTLLTTIYHVTKSAKNHEEEKKRAENPCHSQYIIFMWIDDILKHNHQSSRAKVGMQPRGMKKEAKSCDLTSRISLTYLSMRYDYSDWAILIEWKLKFVEIWLCLGIAQFLARDLICCCYFVPWFMFWCSLLQPCHVFHHVESCHELAITF